MNDPACVRCEPGMTCLGYCEGGKQMDELNLQQARFLLQYVQANKGAGTNLEVLSGMALVFIEMYLGMLVHEMETKKGQQR